MFLNPVMLAGVGAAVVPLALHFLSRSRFRTVDWGGMMFLGQQDVRQRAGMAARQWTLLGLRMAVVGLLAVALARPVVAGWWGDAAGRRRLVVLVVDCSGSTAVEEAGRPRMEAAKEAGLRVLSKLRPDDLAGLIVMGGERQESLVPTDGQAVARRVARLTSTGGAADVAESLTAALDLCEQAERAQPGLAKEVYLICDRQARSWDGVSDAFVSAWQARWQAARRGTRLYLVPVGGESAENVGVESVEAADPPVVRGQPAAVEARVRNYGTQPRAAVPVTLTLGDQTLFSTTVNVEPGAAETVRAVVKLSQAGSQVLSAGVRSADMPGDNRMDLSVAVLDPLKVLLVCADEQQQGGGLRGESAFLKLALAPFSGAAAGGNLAAVTVAKADDPKLDFSGENVVVLANVPKVPDAVLGRLEQFVYAGGGLLIAPGSRTQVGEYRRSLYRNGAGLMPADLRPARPEGASPTSLLGLALDHPVFRFLRGGGGMSPIPAASVARYFPADPRQGDSRVLASYATGDPFLVEGTFGRGRVLLVTTALDADWSDLPLTNVYLPLVQSCVRYLANAPAEPRNVRAGEPLVTTLDAGAGEKSVHLYRPDGAGDDGNLEFSRVGSRVEVRYGRTRVPGVYVLSYGDGKGTVNFAVRPPASESDLTPMGDETWDRLRRALGFEELQVTADEGTAAGFLASLGGRLQSELWQPLVAAVVGLMLLESALARAWTSSSPGGGKS